MCGDPAELFDTLEPGLRELRRFRGHSVAGNILTMSYLAHIILSGRTICSTFDSGDLFSLVVAPLIPDLPDAITTLGIFTMVPSEEVDLPVFQTQLDLITNATDRIVVVAEDISLRGQLSGLYVFEDGHKYDAEWGSWRGEDTWDIIEKGVADRKRKRHDQRNTGV